MNSRGILISQIEETKTGCIPLKLTTLYKDLIEYSGVYWPHLGNFRKDNKMTGILGSIDVVVAIVSNLKNQWECSFEKGIVFV